MEPGESGRKGQSRRMETSGYLLCVCPSVDAHTFASANVFQGRSSHSHPSDRETEAWKLYLAQDHIASVILLGSGSFCFPEGRKDGAGRAEGESWGDPPGGKEWKVTTTRRVPNHLSTPRHPSECRQRGPLGLLCIYPKDASRAESISGELQATDSGLVQNSQKRAHLCA